MKIFIPATLPAGPWHSQGDHVFAGGVAIAHCAPGLADVVAQLPDLIHTDNEIKAAEESDRPCERCVELTARCDMLHTTLQTLVAELEQMTPAQRKRVPAVAALLPSLTRKARKTK